MRIVAHVQRVVRHDRTESAAVLTVYEIYLSDPGRVDARRAAVRVRAAGGLRSALRLVRHAVRVHRRAQDVGRRGAGGGRADSAAALVEITGGEPLLQADVVPLMAATCSTRGYEVLLETGGHVPIDDVPDEVVAIVDVKCPAQRRSRAHALAEPRSALAARRGQVRHPGSRRLRLRARRRRAHDLARRARRGGAVLAGARRARAARARALDARRPPAGRGSRSRRTSTSGARTRGACDASDAPSSCSPADSIRRPPPRSRAATAGRSTG